MNSLINFKMFAALSRAHMATRALELAHAEVAAEDNSKTQFSGWRSRDARSFTLRALAGRSRPIPAKLTAAV